jgi:hypothetical protein
MTFSDNVGPGTCDMGGDANVECAANGEYLKVSDYKCIHRSSYNFCESEKSAAW